MTTMLLLVTAYVVVATFVEEKKDWRYGLALNAAILAGLAVWGYGFAPWEYDHIESARADFCGSTSGIPFALTVMLGTAFGLFWSQERDGVLVRSLLIMTLMPFFIPLGYFAELWWVVEILGCTRS